MRRVIYYGICGLGLIGFISLNVIVCLIKEETFPGFKHIIMIIGYLSIIIFGIGFLLLRKEGKKDVKK
jgi:hypothetical protein